MVSESWHSVSWCWPAVPIQYNTMQYSASLRRSWSLCPLHTFQLWNNAALYEWATVRKVGGMALKRPRNTVLHYQRSPALHSWSFRLSMHVFWSANIHREESAAVVASSLTKSSIMSRNRGLTANQKVLQIQLLSNPVHHPESPRIHSVNPPELFLLQVFLSSTWAHFPGPKWSRRGASHIWVQSNTMVHCDQNNPHSESIVPILLVWLWDNAVIPYCHLID